MRSIEKKLEILRFYEIHIKIVKDLLKCYFKHIFIILVASKRQTYLFKSSLHVFLFQNTVNRTHPKLRRLQRVFISEHSRLSHTLELDAPAHESKSVDRNKNATYKSRNREKEFVRLEQYVETYLLHLRKFLRKFFYNFFSNHLPTMFSQIMQVLLD